MGAIMEDYKIVTNLLTKATHYWDAKSGLCDIIFTDLLGDELTCKKRDSSVVRITVSKIKLSESVLYSLTPLNANRFSIMWTVPNEN